jgi:hypothetical protein
MLWATRTRMTSHEDSSYEQLLKTGCYSYNFGKNTKFLLQQLLKLTCYLFALAIHRLARGMDLLSRSRGLGDAPGRPRGWSRGAGLAGARRTAANAVVPRRRGEEVSRPPVRRRRRARAAVVTRNGALRSLAGLFIRLAGLFVRLAGLFIR